MTAAFEFDPAAREAIAAEVNLSVLKRHDPRTKSVLCSASHVALYELADDDAPQWRRCDIEGSLFLVELHPSSSSPSPPPGSTRAPTNYRIVIHNRKSLDNYCDDLEVGNHDMEHQKQMIMYCNSKRVTIGIWFYEADEAARVFDLLHKIVHGQPVAPQLQRNQPQQQQQQSQPPSTAPAAATSVSATGGPTSTSTSRPKRPQKRTSPTKQQQQQQQQQKSQQRQEQHQHQRASLSSPRSQPKNPQQPPPVASPSSSPAQSQQQPALFQASANPLQRFFPDLKGGIAGQALPDLPSDSAVFESDAVTLMQPAGAQAGNQQKPSPSIPAPASRKLSDDAAAPGAVSPEPTRPDPHHVRVESRRTDRKPRVASNVNSATTPTTTTTQNLPNGAGSMPSTASAQLHSLESRRDEAAANLSKRAEPGGYTATSQTAIPVITKSIDQRNTVTAGMTVGTPTRSPGATNESTAYVSGEAKTPRAPGAAVNGLQTPNGAVAKALPGAAQPQLQKRSQQASKKQASLEDEPAQPVPQQQRQAAAMPRGSHAMPQAPPMGGQMAGLHPGMPLGPLAPPIGPLGAPPRMDGFGSNANGVAPPPPYAASAKAMDDAQRMVESLKLQQAQQQMQAMRAFHIAGGDLAGGGVASPPMMRSSLVPGGGGPGANPLFGPPVHPQLLLLHQQHQQHMYMQQMMQKHRQQQQQQQEHKQRQEQQGEEQAQKASSPGSRSNAQAGTTNSGATAVAQKQRANELMRMLNVPRTEAASANVAHEVGRSVLAAQNNGRVGGTLGSSSGSKLGRGEFRTALQRALSDETFFNSVYEHYSSG